MKMRDRMRSFVLALSFSLVTALGVPASDPVSVHVTPQIGFAPLTVRARVHIERNEINREACLVIGDFTSTCWQLDGAQSPITFWKEFRDLPADEYAVVAIVSQTQDRSIRSFAVPVHSVVPQERF